MNTSKLKLSKLKSIKLNPKKMKKNYFKLGVFAVFMMAASLVNAQTLPANSGTANTTQANAAGEVIKVIDNKGTIKYIQANNGITSITSTAANNKTTTTWQLGGTLVEDTNIATGLNEFKITLDAGGTFVIDGIVEETGNAAAAMGGPGFSLLVRDEATGEVRNILKTDLIDVVLVEQQLGADTSADISITVTGVLLASTSVNRIAVYRNGVKLRESTDYSISADDTVQVDIAAIGGEAYNLDVFEVQWIK
ncbi:MAG: hypothetical protein BM563_05105 [Bacteroidetes bacterium MedPE-SWsnd-G1]|nr:MAG: hypothetical protein BM563_05105 [Bacteroidetes bacterium MedPE-SWsnd-G1]